MVEQCCIVNDNGCILDVVQHGENPMMKEIKRLPFSEPGSWIVSRRFWGISRTNHIFRDVRDLEEFVPEERAYSPIRGYTFDMNIHTALPAASP